ncbi:hypothetical protein AAFN85_15390 [Mucilaginibacter sp. CAU 1740]|uniref:hypothetical protein n=1 Tax=Mucilaginibacter sp. CAU 1740 TaxID=3140365 RepID=UPI00325A80C6
MKKTLLAIAAISFLAFAGCQKNNVAPSKDSVSTKSTKLDAASKSKDTIWISSKAAPAKSAPKDTIWLK